MASSELFEFQGVGFAVVVCIVSAVAIYLVSIFSDPKWSKLLNQIPGPKRYPLIGSSLEFVGITNEDMVKLADRYIREHGKRYVISIGHVNYIGLSYPEGIERLLSSSTHITKADVYNNFGPWLGTGLLTSTGKKWSSRRKLLTPSFHFKILEDFVTVFNDQARIFVDLVNKEIAGSDEAKDICPYVSRYTLDVICETAMGVKLNAQIERDSPYVTAVNSICGILQYRYFRPWLIPNFTWRLHSKSREERACLNTILDFSNSIIASRKKEREAKLSADKKNDANGNEDDVYFGKRKRLAFLDMLLEAQATSGTNLTDEDIREEVDTFMFEGHDTTAANIGWTLYLLANYPEHQEKVREELNAIFGEDRERHVTTEDITRMKHLDMCVKESLRLYPSVPFIARLLNEDFILDTDVVVPKGMNVFIMPYYVHRNEEIYPDPEKFDPYRFSPENSASRHPYAYVPFSAGPRNCIGQKFALLEEKVILSHILRNFRIEPTMKMKEVVVMMEIICRPKDGFPVKMYRI